jgi:hypothetical protein
VYPLRCVGVFVWRNGRRRFAFVEALSLEFHLKVFDHSIGFICGTDIGSTSVFGLILFRSVM